MSKSSAVPSVVTLTADSVEELRARASRAASELTPGAPARPLPVGSWNRAQGQGRFRAAFTCADAAEARRKLAMVDSALERPSDAGPLSGLGIFVNGGGRAPGKLALMFPGQGGQYGNMLGELGRVYTVVGETIAEGDAAFQAIAGRSLSETYRSKAADGSFEPDESTSHAAVMLVNLALYRLMRACGVSPGVLLGQSAGEYAALVASGMWPLEVGLRAIYQRTLRVLEVPAERGGRMASVACGAERLRILARGLPGWLGVASDNCPTRITISGAVAALEALRDRCEAEGIDFVPLPISHGYHSHLIEQAVPRLQGDLGGLALSAPRLPVFSSVDGLYYRPEVTAGYLAHHLARQLTTPVSFIDHVQRLRRDGVDFFAECGPKASLTSFVGEILGPAHDYVACASVHPKVGEVEQFHRLLAALFTYNGLEPRGLTAFDADEAAAEIQSAPAAVAQTHGAAIQIEPSVAAMADPAVVAPGQGTARTGVPAGANGVGPAAVQSGGPTSVPAVSAAEVETFLVEAMVEKTGYPAELLEPDLDLEADLGIDTVKQVDVLGLAFRRFAVLPDKKLKVRDYNTLRKLTGLVQERAGSALSAATEAGSARAAVPSIATEAVSQQAVQAGGNGVQVAPTVGNETAQAGALQGGAAAAMPVVSAAEVETFLVEAMVEKTGYPADLLEPDLDLEADLGIDTVKQVDVLGLAFRRFAVLPDKKLKVRDYNTLRKLTGLVHRRAGSALSASTEMEADALASVPAAPAQVPAPGQPAPAQVPTAPVAEAPGREEIQLFVVRAMADRTGYPADLLETHLDLEADLGIDAVKQADVLRQACERFGKPYPREVRLRELNTLDKVVRLIAGSQDSCTLPAPAGAPRASAPAISYAIPPVAGPWRAVRYVLDARPMPLDPRSGERYRFTGKHLVVTMDPYGVARRLVSRLSQAGARVTQIHPSSDRLPQRWSVDFAQPDSVRELMRCIQAQVGPIDGVYHLAPLAPEAPLSELEDAEWHRMVEQASTGLLGLTQPLYDHFESSAPGETFFIVASNMGGCLGVNTRTPGSPLCGAYTGFLKSLRRELPGSLLKVVDFDVLNPVEQIAQHLFDELALLNPQLECGYLQHRRHVVSPVRRELSQDHGPLVVDSDWVFVVSGGGRGVVYEVVRQLAGQFRPTIYITGRTAVPAAHEPWLAFDRKQLAAWRNPFFAEERGRRPDARPADLRAAFQAVERAWELHHNLRAMARFANVQYRVCDVGDRAQVEALVKEIRAKHGRIDAVVHGAMVEESKSLPMKTDELYRRTMATKVHGAYNLMQATRQDRLKLFMNFGSGAGRFGNKGQTDYAAAGDLLNKLTLVYHRQLAPHARVVTIDWPAWKGAGWVENNPHIEQMLRDGALSTFIEVDEGVAWFVGEMLYGGDAEEIIVAGDRMMEALSLGLLAPQFSRSCAALGLDSAAGQVGSARPS